MSVSIYASLISALLFLFGLAWAKPGQFPERLVRLGQTPYPPAFVRIGKHWLVYTYPVGPLVRDGRVLVPVRALAEMMGAKVEWDGAGAVVHWQGKSARFPYQPASRTGPVLLKSYRSLLVPLRSLIEPLG